MSRSGYIDDCEGLNLYRGRVANALKGKRGQSFFRELAEEMDAMPIKELIAQELINKATGSCCTIGVICKSRGIDVSKIDCDEPDAVARAVGISTTMAAEIEWMNDEAGRHDEPPTERWTRIRKWVEEQILT